MLTSACRPSAHSWTNSTLDSRTAYDATAFTPGVTTVVTFEYDYRGRVT
jgi:hypothetical protein